MANYTRKYIVNTNEDSLSFYLLGAWMTDGWLSDKKSNVYFGIGSKDNEWVESIRNIVCPEKPIYKHKSGLYCYFKASNMDWFVSLGCTTKKSKTLKIEKNIPKEYHRDFIRGAIDGDGSLSSSSYKKVKNNKTYYYKKHTVYLCSASKMFLEQVQDMIPSDIRCNLFNCGKPKGKIKDRTIIGKCDVHRLIFNDSNALKFTKWIYYQNNDLSLCRKNKIALSWLG